MEETTMREKLIELLDMNCGYVSEVPAAELADHLIANGVTVQEWISVKDRLPEKYGEHILVCYSDGWICDQYTPVDNGVTHWMPLPQPAKGE
jgi:hypothetical protein